MNEADKMLKEWRRSTHLTGLGIVVVAIVLGVVLFRADSAPIVLGALVCGAFWAWRVEEGHARLYRRFGGKDDDIHEVRESIKCPPERIRPAVRKGSCGVSGCGIKTPHSHVDDLSRRLSGH